MRRTLGSPCVSRGPTPGKPGGFGPAIPLEIRYDDYGVEIPENQLLRGAAERLLKLPQIDATTRRSLLRVVRTVADVTSVPRGDQLPLWQPSRLNARYQIALRLAELVLRGSSVEQEHGSIQINGFMPPHDRNPSGPFRAWPKRVATGTSAPQHSRSTSMPGSHPTRFDIAEMPEVSWLRLPRPRRPADRSQARRADTHRLDVARGRPVTHRGIGDGRKARYDVAGLGCGGGRRYSRLVRQVRATIPDGACSDWLDATCRTSRGLRPPWSAQRGTTGRQRGQQRAEGRQPWISAH